MRQESEDAARVGIEALVLAFFFGFVAVVYLFGRNWYAKSDEYISTRNAITEQADVYKFESIGRVSGVDAAEFIIRYDSYYDYYICTKSTANSVSDIKTAYRYITDSNYQNDQIPCDIKITKYRYNSLLRSNSNRNHQIADNLWSEDYLIYDVFGSYLIYDYYVYPFIQNDSTVAYIFVRAAN